MTEENIKNYYNSKERKFTILQLEIRPLTLIDVCTLLIYAGTIVVCWFFSKDNYSIRTALLLLPMIMFYLVNTSPFGLRFRNVYFFTAWFLLSVVYLWVEPTKLSYYPLANFILYQLLRWKFWQKYQREFIPYTVVRGSYSCKKGVEMPGMIRYLSKIEGRGGYREDKDLMKILFWLGFILFFGFMFSIVGVDLKKF